MVQGIGMATRGRYMGRRGFGRVVHSRCWSGPEVVVSVVVSRLAKLSFLRRGENTVGWVIYRIEDASQSRIGQLDACREER